MRLARRIALALGALALVALVVVTVLVGGPRNLIGILRYDQRRPGSLHVGDRAPDVALLALDGRTPVHLADPAGGRPTVLIFGSFT